MEQSVKLAVMTVALTKCRGEVCASGTEQTSKNAVTKDAPMEPSKEGYALRMGQRSQGAVMTDARTKLSEEESAGGMVQKLLPERIAAMTHAPMESSAMVCARGMAQNKHLKLAVMKDA